MATPARYCSKCQKWFVGGCPEGHKPKAGKTPTVITASKPPSAGLRASGKPKGKGGKK